MFLLSALVLSAPLAPAVAQGVNNPNNNDLVPIHDLRARRVSSVDHHLTGAFFVADETPDANKLKNIKMHILEETSLFDPKSSGWKELAYTAKDPVKVSGEGSKIEFTTSDTVAINGILAVSYDGKVKEGGATVSEVSFAAYWYKGNAYVVIPKRALRAFGNNVLPITVHRRLDPESYFAMKKAAVYANKDFALTADVYVNAEANHGADNPAGFGTDWIYTSNTDVYVSGRKTDVDYEDKSMKSAMFVTYGHTQFGTTSMNNWSGVVRKI